jgi:hypothetical protein
MIEPTLEHCAENIFSYRSALPMNVYETGGDLQKPSIGEVFDVYIIRYVAGDCPGRVALVNFVATIDSTVIVLMVGVFI